MVAVCSRAAMRGAICRPVAGKDRRMSLSEQEVRHVAMLARLALTDEEVAEYKARFQAAQPEPIAPWSEYARSEWARSPNRASANLAFATSGASRGSPKSSTRFRRSNTLS